MFEFKAVTDYLLIRIYRYGIRVTDGRRDEYIDFSSGKSFWSELDEILSDENISTGRAAQLWQDIEKEIKNHPKNWKTAFHEVIARFGKKYRRAAVLLSVAEAFDVTEYNDTKVPGISSLSKKDKINLVKNDINRVVYKANINNLHIKVVPTPDGARRYISELTYLDFVSDLITSSGLQPFFIGYDDVINYNLARRHRSAPLYIHFRLCGSRIWAGAWERDAFLGSRLFPIEGKDIPKEIAAEILRHFSTARFLKQPYAIKADLKGFAPEVAAAVREHLSAPDSPLNRKEELEIIADPKPTVLEEWGEVSQDYAAQISLLPRNFFYLPVIKRISLALLLFTVCISSWSAHFLYNKYQNLSTLRQQAIMADAMYEGVKKSFAQKISNEYSIFDKRQEIKERYKIYASPRVHLYPYKITYGVGTITNIKYDEVLRVRISFKPSSNFAERLDSYKAIYAQLQKIYGLPDLKEEEMERKIALNFASSILDEEFEYDLRPVTVIVPKPQGDSNG